MVRKVVAMSVMVVLSLASACAPVAPMPMPTPEPKPSPVWILASEPGHLEGIWFFRYAMADNYFWWGADGTIWKTKEAKENTRDIWGRFWFEEGVYYEERVGVPGIGSYEAHLEIQEGRAVRLRMKVVEDTRDFGDSWPRHGNIPYLRVD